MQHSKPTVTPFEIARRTELIKLQDSKRKALLEQAKVKPKSK